MNLRRAIFAALLALMLASPTFAQKRSALSIHTEAEGGVRVSVSPVKSSGWGLLQVVDAKDGTVLKTLHAGRFDPNRDYFANPDALTPAGPPGIYKLRYREAIQIVLDGELKRPDATNPKWINPVDIVLTPESIFVLDGGLDVQETRPNQLADREWSPAGAPASATGRFASLENGVVSVVLKDGGAIVNYKLDALPAAQQETAKQLEKGRQEMLAERAAKAPFLYKMDRQGKLDATFAQAGKLPGGYVQRGFAVDPVSGNLYYSSGGHEILVIDPKGTRLPQTVGGWDGDPGGPKCTIWVNSFSVAGKNRIYIPNGGYGHGRVYDRTQDKFGGIQYSFVLPQYNGTDRYVTADATANGAVYITGRSNQIAKYFDDGKSMKIAYVSDPELKLVSPTGGSARAGLVAWACRGPSPGPFWDSGGGGEVVLFYDDGRSLRVIERFGTLGQAANQLEFLNPSAAILSHDQKELYIAEDGLTNIDGPPGNARIRRFILKPAWAEEVSIKLGK